MHRHSIWRWHFEGRLSSLWYVWSSPRITRRTGEDLVHNGILHRSVKTWIDSRPRSDLWRVEGKLFSLFRFVLVFICWCFRMNMRECRYSSVEERSAVIDDTMGFISDPLRAWESRHSPQYLMELAKQRTHLSIYHLETLRGWKFDIFINDTINFGPFSFQSIRFSISSTPQIEKHEKCIDGMLRGECSIFELLLKQLSEKPHRCASR